MSERVGRFCDGVVLVANRQTESGGWEQSNAPCPNLSTGTCAICDRDTCPKHALHPSKPALVIFVGLTRQETPPGAPGHPPVDTHLTEKTAAAIVCEECGYTLHEVFSEVTKDVKVLVVERLRAALTAKRLSDGGT